MKRVFAGLAILVLALIAVAVFGPRERVEDEISFDASVIGPDVDGYLANVEARFDDIRPGTEKRVIWAGERGTVTPIAVLYVHGFSATSEEIRPVPDRVAQGLGANLVFTRLTGHGRTGEALGAAMPGDWIEDMAEAVAVASRVGERVLIISTSTGGTASAIAAATPDLNGALAGVAFVSPNFGVRMNGSQILTLPFVRIWGPWLVGTERAFDPVNEAHGKFWTTRYDTQAVFSMAALVRYANALDYSGVTAPALFVFSDGDAVVSPKATRRIAERWGGPVTLAPTELAPGNDPYNHVLAGDILSPGGSDPAIDTILTWARGL